MFCWAFLQSTILSHQAPEVKGGLKKSHNKIIEKFYFFFFFFYFFLTSLSYFSSLTETKGVLNFHFISDSAIKLGNCAQKTKQFLKN